MFQQVSQIGEIGIFSFFGSKIKIRQIAMKQTFFTFLIQNLLVHSVLHKNIVKLLFSFDEFFFRSCKTFDFCLEKSWNQIGIENWGIKSVNILNILDILGGKFVNSQRFCSVKYGTPTSVSSISVSPLLK